MAPRATPSAANTQGGGHVSVSLLCLTGLTVHGTTGNVRLRGIATLLCCLLLCLGRQLPAPISQSEIFGAEKKVTTTRFIPFVRGYRWSTSGWEKVPDREQMQG
jgi:hypothetical protein